MYIWLVLLVTLCFGGIGFLDDYLMLIKKRNKGLSGRSKMFWQIVMALIPAVFLYLNFQYNTRLNIPFFKTLTPDLGWGYILLAVFIIVGTSNAVNLTDGLDGLAIGPATIAFGTYLLAQLLVAGTSKSPIISRSPMFPDPVNWPFFAGPWSGPALVSSGLTPIRPRSLWEMWAPYPWGRPWAPWPSSPRTKFSLILVGGLFVIEALSVIFQVGYFKMTHGKRIFRMAPLHHHFELKGWSEPKIIVRFWIIAVILSLLSLSTLKLR